MSFILQIWIIFGLISSYSFEIIQKPENPDSSMFQPENETDIRNGKTYLDRGKDFGFYNCNRHFPRNCVKLHNHHCFVCKEDSPSAAISKGETVCESENAIVLRKVFEILNETTDMLHIVILNRWKGYLPITPLTIDIRPLEKFTKLKSFKLTRCFESYNQPYHIRFHQDTFKNLTSITSLQINIASTDQSLRDIVSPLTNLRRLDLSYTREISMYNMTDTLHAISKTQLHSLYLTTFQRAGCNGYEFYLNMSDFFSGQKYRALKNLVLNANSLARISPGITNIAPNLMFLDISDNIILDAHNFPFILEVLIHPRIETFNMSYQGYVGGNKVKWLDKESSNNDKGLQTFHMNEREDPVVFYSYKFAIACFNRNTAFHGAGPNISALFSDCKKQNQQGSFNLLQCLLSSRLSKTLKTKMPQLADIFNTKCALFIEIPLAPNLHSFKFSQLHWEAAAVSGIGIGGELCFKENSLNHFQFKNNGYWVKPAQVEQILSYSPITGLANMTSLDMSNNGMTLNLTRVTANLHMPNLQTFKIGNNNISMDLNFRLCHIHPKLEKLDYSSNGLGNNNNFSAELVTGCANLKELDLSSNFFSNSDQNDSKIPFNISLRGLDKLQLLNLSNNILTKLDDNVMHEIDNTVKSTPPLVIDLSANPLVCNCRTIPFTSWVIRHMTNKTPSVTFHGFQDYKCLDIDSRLRTMSTISIDDLLDFNKHCFPNKIYLYLQTVLVTLACVFLLFGCWVTYKKRWRIRYKMYSLKQTLTRLCRSRSKTPVKEWKYDAFVSYCSDDRFWVHGEFLKTLEKVYGFNLCLRYRDFEIGAAISDEILTSIEQSREIIIIISDAALAHEWNHFELEHGNLYCNRRRKKLIIIKMGKMEHIGKSALAANLMDLNGYIEWSEEKESVPLFWDKLVKRLYAEDYEKSCYKKCKWCFSNCLRRHRSGYEQLQESVDSGIRCS